MKQDKAQEDQNRIDLTKRNERGLHPAMEKETARRRLRRKRRKRRRRREKKRRCLGINRENYSQENTVHKKIKNEFIIAFYLYF